MSQPEQRIHQVVVEAYTGHWEVHHHLKTAAQRRPGHVLPATEGQR